MDTERGIVNINNFLESCVFQEGGRAESPPGCLDSPARNENRLSFVFGRHSKTKKITVHEKNGRPPPPATQVLSLHSRGEGGVPD